jgi:protein-tyrosine phosphatase
MDILFICTGNYYRSRFAEIYFNYLAEQAGLSQRSFSRGLEVFRCRNVGALSGYTRNRLLEQHHIELPASIAYPCQIQTEDFQQASLSIALDKKEHYPMMQEYFPEWAEKIVYWDFEDIQFVSYQEMLPGLEKKIELFVQELQTGQH